MVPRFLFSLAVGLFVFWARPVFAETFRAADGETARKLLQKAQPGDEVVLASGQWKDVDLRLVGTGTAEHPVVVRAEKPGATVFTGASRIRIGGDHVMLSGVWMKDISGSKADWLELRIDSKQRANHCKVTECAFTENPEFTAAEKENRWIGMYGESNALERCHFEGKKNKGTTVVVWLGESDIGRHVIRGNYFGSRPLLGKNGGEALRIGDSKTSMQPADCIVEGNLFERCDGETECISNKSCGNGYRANTFREVQGTLTLRHGNDCVVEGNFFLGNHRKFTGGIRIIGEGHRVVNNYLDGLEGDDFRTPLTLVNGIPDSPDNGYLQVKQAVVAFNTIVDCKNGMLIGYNDEEEATLAPAGCRFVGNVIAPRDERSAEIAVAPGAEDLVWSVNLAGGPPGPDLPGIIWKDPLLRKGDGGLWRPVADSPVVDAVANASAADAPMSDMDGQARDSRPDAGADERSDAPVTLRPLAREDVGPAWRVE